MNHDSFEKMDKEFLAHLRSVREKKVPEVIRRNFKRSVEGRLLSSGRPGSFGLSFIAAPAFVLVLGAALYWFFLKPAPPAREVIPSETELQKKEIVQPKVNVSELSVPVRASVPALEQLAVHSNVQIDNQPAALQNALSPVTESNIVSEVEALKELGVWTDKDEEEIGITPDQIFEELETLAGELLTGANGVNVPSTSSQG